MKIRLAVIFLCVAVIFCASPAARADSFTFGVLPVGGAISGPPGSTIGWGYTFTNQSATSWLMLTAVSADVFLNGTPDASVFDFPILAPGDTLSQAYDPANFLGLFQLTWDSTAPVGFTNSGLFVVSGEWWDGDPFAGGQLLGTDQQSAAYSAAVTPVATVPEPATLTLLVIGLAAFRLRRHRQRGR